MVRFIKDPDSLVLSSVQAGDEEFLYAVYCDTRREEVTAWGWDESQQNAFLHMQFRMQQQSYQMQFPGSEHYLILLNGEKTGRLMVDKMPEHIHLVDIALLAGHRGKGIGTFLIKKLQAEAAESSKPVILQVQKTNDKAKRLYEHLNFGIYGESDFTYEMRWNP